MTRRRNGAASIEDSRQLLADTNAQMEDARRRRTDELRGTADANELDKFDTEIKRLEIIASRHMERIALIEASEREAEAERQNREKASLVDRLEKKLAERHEVAVQISAAIKSIDGGLRRLIDIARDTQAARPWQGSDLAPCLLGPSAIVTAIEHELYRVGARPVLGGGQDKFGAGIDLPGGKPPRLELAGMPSAISPLVAVMDQATALASNILRGKQPGVVAPAPVALVADTDRKQTGAQAELSQLLNRQSELALDLSPEGERAYDEIVAQIALMTHRVEHEKQESTNA
jgi:hypothetical protein